MKIIIFVLSVFLVSGCAGLYEPVPRGYAGETATIEDTYSNLRGRTADYFVAYEIDGKSIYQSWHQTKEANLEGGSRFSPSMTSRKVIPKKQKLSLRGFAYFISEAQELFSDDMRVENEIIFTPKAGETYKVKGVLGTSGSKVWLEDSSGKFVESEGGS